ENHILVDRRHTRVCDLKIHVTVVSKLDIELAAFGVQRYELFEAGEENARRNAAVPGPIGYAAKRRKAFGQFVAPDFLPRFRIESDDAISRGHVHDAVDDNGCDLLKDLAWACSLIHCGNHDPRFGPQ